MRILKKTAIILIKLSFAAAALYYVLQKTDVSEIRQYIASSNPMYLALSFLSLSFSAVFSAVRLRVYFKDSQIKISQGYTLIIYYIGMFFNIVLPGGIGGDGYVTIHVMRKLQVPAKHIIRLLLTARANGLFFLNIALYIFLWNSIYADIPWLRIVIIILLFAQIVVYFTVTKYILKEAISTFLKAGFYSAITQISSILGAYFVFKAIGVNSNFLEYLSLYLVAAIAALVPVTPGGVGIRELVFYQGSTLAKLDPHVAVSGSLIYFAIYFLVSIPGLIFYLLGIQGKGNNHGINTNSAS